MLATHGGIVNNHFNDYGENIWVTKIVNKIPCLIKLCSNKPYKSNQYQVQQATFEQWMF